MVELVKEELEFCNRHIETINKIVITASCGCIPKDYIEGLKEINKKYNFTQCITCNSSIFLATNKLYKSYLYTNGLKNQKNNSKKQRRVKQCEEKQERVQETTQLVEKT